MEDDYTKEELATICKKLDEAVSKLDEVRFLLKKDDYNAVNGYPRFVHQAENYQSEYKRMLGEKLISDMLDDMEEKK